MSRKGMSGWFVEIPTDMKSKFKELYPGRAAQRRLTIAAIEWAIRSHETLKGGSANQNRQLRADNGADLSTETSAADQGRLDKSQAFRRTWIRNMLA